MSVVQLQNLPYDDEVLAVEHISCSTEPVLTLLNLNPSLKDVSFHVDPDLGETITDRICCGHFFLVRPKVKKFLLRQNIGPEIYFLDTSVGLEGSLVACTREFDSFCPKRSEGYLDEEGKMIFATKPVLMNSLIPKRDFFKSGRFWYFTISLARELEANFTGFIFTEIPIVDE